MCHLVDILGKTAPPHMICFSRDYYVYFRCYNFRMHKLIIRHARQIVKVCDNYEPSLHGTKQKKVAILEDPNEGCSLVVGKDGGILDLGKDSDIQEKYMGCQFERELNASGKCLIPGLIDGHTHPVWVGDRVHEFAMKLAGASYMDIHKAGGGIHFTVNHVHEASEEDLYQSLVQRLDRMVRCGSTFIEAKSGYGLDAENEIKMLRVIERAKREFSSLEISSTYCGAHAIPKGKTMLEATEDVVNVQIPQIKGLIDAGELTVENIDVFCEQGVFDNESSRRILQAGKDAGMAINFHGDELHPMNSGELGASLGARAISHLEEVSDNGIKAMAECDVTAVLLPTTAYILKLKPPPARQMIEQGVAVALGSDFNPNAFCYSMPLVMHMACCILRMSMDEALAGATINAAASIGKSKTHGSLEIGKMADIVVVDAPRWEHLVYQLGGHVDVISHVIKKGTVVHER